MEKEIGGVPDRAGFEVHVDGEEITITQYNDDFDCDMILIHASDAKLLADLLDKAAAEAANNHNAKEPEETQPVNANCAGSGPHSPDGTCCPPPPCTDPFYVGWSR